MKMYVANGTRQVANFIYRLPGAPGLKNHFIPVGRQVLLPFDLNTEEVNYIIESHSKYGLVNVKDIDQTKTFIGMCYSIDKPVPPPKLHSVMEHNLDVLTEQGRKNRQLAAVAANDVLERSLDDNPGLADLAGMEMTIVEETKAGRSVDDTPLSEGFHVSRSFNQDENGKQLKGGRNANRGGGRKNNK